MGNRILTMESLVEFCKSQKTFSFNAKETGHPLVVSTYGRLEYSAENDEGLMPVHLKGCHVGLNRNGSHIDVADMNAAMPSLANKPILAEITTNSKGEIDFGTHAIEEIEDDNGEKKLYYIEHPIGIIPESCNAHLEYDEDEEKDYVHADGYIYTLYGNEAAEILERRKGTDCSVELEIYEFAWDAKNKWLSLKSFIFNGLTLLGSDFIPGMKGARCEISSFSHYESFDYSKELAEMNSRLAILEAKFSSDNKETKEGGQTQVNKLEELLSQYGKTLEDLDFEYEGMSDDELEAKFKEVFEGDNDTPSTEEPEVVTEGQDDNDNDSGDDAKNETEDEGRTIPEGSVMDDDEAGSGKKNSDFALSLQDKINALQNLVSATYDSADNEWYGTICYDSYVVMIGYFGGQAYKQNYKAENDEYQLVGDRVRVYEQFLTQDEMDALESMKSEFTALKEYKANIEKNELAAQKDVLISEERFDCIRDTEEFAAVVRDVENYSLEELETKFKLIFADIQMVNSTFSSKDISKQKTGKMFTIPSKGGNPVESKYGGIFSEKN